MKILAKTKGPTLVCSSGDFLDSYKYRLVSYDPQVRGWNNRDLLEISGFVNDLADPADLEVLTLEGFLKKWADKPEAEEVQPEVKTEVEEVEEPKIEVKKNRKNKK